MKKDKLTTFMIVLLDILLVVALIGLLFFFRSFFASILTSVVNPEGVEKPRMTNSPDASSSEGQDSGKNNSLNISAGTYSDTFSESGYEMDYYLYVPDLATEDMPLLIFLHGIGEVGSLKNIEQNPIMETAWDIYGSKYPFLILAPNTNIESWTNKTVASTLKDLIDSVIEDYKIDADRIYITGFSLGATGVYNMIKEYGDFFNGAVIISAPAPEDVDPSTCIAVPLRTFAGSTESECDIPMQTLADKINELGGDAKHTTLVGFDHNQVPYGAFTESLYKWMLQDD